MEQKNMSEEDHNSHRVHSNNWYRTHLCYVLYINSSESNYSHLWQFDYTVFRKKHPLTFSSISPWVMCRFKQKLQWIYL